jgi:hypothetical protein
MFYILCLDTSKQFGKVASDIALVLMEKCGWMLMWLSVLEPGWKTVLREGWLIDDWSPTTWRAISTDLEGCVLACVLPTLSIDDLDEITESMLIKFADDIKQSRRQLTWLRSKMISTAWNNNLTLTWWNLIGINGGSCTWVQKSNYIWDGGEVAKLQDMGKNP